MNGFKVDLESEFGAYELSSRQKIARCLASRTNVKSLINLFRAVGGLRGCKIADVTVYGSNMRVYPGANRSDKIMLGMPHVFDRKEREVLASQLRAEKLPSFVDVGANIGAYSAYVKGLGLDTKIIAIEADPEMFARLSFNIPGGVTKLNVAVADEEGTLPFYINDHNRGENSLVSGVGKRIEVKALTLSRIIEQNGIDVPTVIKIDVEGMEEKILESYFKSTPSDKLAKMIILEYIHNQKLLSIMADKGYKIKLRTKLNAVFCR